ncbi:hypothetical protein J8281_03585 [Aquimarina sp. U1-2]|uniref:peptidoglycan-binding domain-containing protein n=1 Tax=Aquimarina sp. U1-2 TaxID=2823141 RepID=UPI001AECA02C|nr:hypothetical protein [Aquimarina sp. U1-2]MBP2831260.1 hypothetical protein [Aquimarina sp. U1-2]
MATQTIKTVQKKPLSAEEKRRAGLRKKYVMYGLGAGVLLGGGYLLYNYLQDRAALNRSTQTPVIPPKEETNIIIQQNSSSFPLKRGSRGNLISMLQNALLAFGGEAANTIRSTSIRSGKTDGIFGPGTERALRAAGYTAIVSENDFSRLLSIGKAKADSGLVANQSNQVIAAELIKAANSRNLFATIAGLQKLQDVNQYIAVSNFFKGIRINGIRVTSLVNALLSVAFKSNESGKVKIRAEFRRIGLKQNSKGVWYIPGLGAIATWQDWKDYREDRQLFNIAIARRPTMLKAMNGDSIIPALNPNTVIGFVTGDHRGVTQILTQSGETVYAPSQNLKLI